jgi:PAS domain S-box-containing protein
VATPKKSTKKGTTKSTTKSAADRVEPPSGSASFYLNALGGALGTQPISLETIVDTTPDAILFVDTARRIRFWNRGAERMFGYTREEATGAYYDLLLPSDLKISGELEQLERMTRERGIVLNYLTRRAGKDGAERIVSLSRSALKDSNGEIVGWTAILRDATNQVRVEQELSRARSLAMVGQLAANVAHEIKNPLAGIHGATQILLNETKPGDPKREVLERIANEIRRLDATVRDLLRFAKPETPRLDRKDLREYASKLAHALREDPRFARVEFEFLGEKGFFMHFDERLLHQVLQNLFENACDAVDGNGTITVSFRLDGADAVVEVSDSGPGIPEENLDRVFEPFFTTKPRGTGLGLAICRKNIEAHGGTMSVSNDEGGGARFSLRFPAQPTTFVGKSARDVL